MGKLTVLGLGPGSMDYITPAVLHKVQSAETIIGGKRNLAIIKAFTKGKQVKCIDQALSQLLDYIKLHMGKKMVIVASGDAGFYGILDFVKRNFHEDEIDVIPGISSMQYMFSRISESWWDAYLTSVHGRESDYIDKLGKYHKIGILTDKRHNPQYIARELVASGYSEAEVIVGENLSYSCEKIRYFKASDLAGVEDEFGLNVVVVRNY